MNHSSEPFRMAHRMVLEEIRPHRGWFLALGILLIALGTGAILFPLIATLTAALLLGWVLVIAGFAQAAHSFRVRPWRGFLLHTLAAVLTLAVGALLLLYPLPSVTSLTLLIGAFFVVEGTFRSALALRIRPAPRWGWMLAGGVVSLLFGVLVFAQWPAVATWLLGLLVGVDLLFTGWGLVGLSMAAGRHDA